MGLFDKLKKKNNSLAIEEIASKDYNQIYFEECKYIYGKIMFLKMVRQLICKENC